MEQATTNAAQWRAHERELADAEIVEAERRAVRAEALTAARLAQHRARTARKSRRH